MPGQIIFVDVLAVVGLIMHGCIASNCAASQLENDLEFHQAYDLLEEFSLSRKYLSEDFLEIVPIETQHLARYDLEYKSLLEHAAISNRISKSSKTEYEVSDSQRRERIKGVIPSDKYADDVFSVSQEYNIDPLLLHAIAEIESQYNPKAVSSVGAKGLMQIMPKTARRFGMVDPENELFDPLSNLRLCSIYLRSLYRIFGNNLPLILAAYNAGENAVIKHDYQIPPYVETQLYVSKVMNRYLEMKSLSVDL